MQIFKCLFPIKIVQNFSKKSRKLRPIYFQSPKERERVMTPPKYCLFHTHFIRRNCYLCISPEFIVAAKIYSRLLFSKSMFDASFRIFFADAYLNHSQEWFFSTSTFFLECIQILLGNRKRQMGKYVLLYFLIITHYVSVCME